MELRYQQRAGGGEGTPARWVHGGLRIEDPEMYLQSFNRYLKMIVILFRDVKQGRSPICFHSPATRYRD